MTRNSKNKRNLNRNNLMILLIIGTIVIVSVCLIVNIVSINNRKVEEVDVDTVSKSKYTNSQYTIGNNPTEINKTYFDELTAAVDGSSDRDTVAISEALVKCFITEYYTWTNKDGNYDLGGMQYIYTNKQSDFEDYSRYNFYADLDLYLNRYKSSDLIQVKEVTISSSNAANDYTVTYAGTDDTGAETTETATLPCVAVVANWTYEEGGALDTSSFQNTATFYVADNNGRMEIVGIDSTGSASEVTE